MRLYHTWIRKEWQPYIFPFRFWIDIVNTTWGDLCACCGGFLEDKELMIVYGATLLYTSNSQNNVGQDPLK